MKKYFTENIIALILIFAIVIGLILICIFNEDIIKFIETEFPKFMSFIGAIK